MATTSLVSTSLHPINLLLAAALALSGCASRGGNVPYEPKNFGAPDLETLDVPSGPQRIGPLDKINITVFKAPEMSGDFQVDSGGRIIFPLLGSLEVQGLTADELAQDLARRLDQRLVRNPNVQVQIAEATERTITVDGAVQKPGVVPIKGSTTLMRAVALASGMTDDANPARVLIFRTIDGQRMAAAYDLRSIRRAEAVDPPVYGNDIVIVDGSSTRKAFRDIISSIPILGIFRPF